MGEVEHMTKLVTYNRRVLERFERAVQRRGWAEAVRDRGTGHGSLKDTLVHILNVHEAWLVGVAQDHWEIFRRADRQPAQIRSWSELGRYHRSVWSGVDRLVVDLSEARLRRRLRAPWMPGVYTLEDAFYQTTVEQAHHLGEVIAAFWQRNWRPPSMTWIENSGRRVRSR